MRKIAVAWTGPAQIAGVMTAFAAGTLLAPGLLSYLLGHRSLGAVLAAWAIMTLSAISAGKAPQTWGRPRAPMRVLGTLRRPRVHLRRQLV